MHTNKSFLGFVLLLIIESLSSIAFADTFPDSYIKNELAEANNGLVVDVSHLPEGKMMSVKYLDRPVFIYHRKAADLKTLQGIDPKTLVDPDDKKLQSQIRAEYGASSSEVWARLLLLTEQTAISKKPFRSLKPEYLVIGGWSPEGGCMLTFIPGKESNAAVMFRDPCTSAEFDAAGRIFAGTLKQRAGSRLDSYNVAVPPYHYLSDGRIALGPEKGQKIPALNISPADLYPHDDPTKRLIYAARYNDLATVKQALKAGGKAYEFVLGEGSPLDAAVVGSSFDVIKLLVKNGARPTSNTRYIAKALRRQDVIDYLGPYFFKKQ